MTTTVKTWALVALMVMGCARAPKLPNAADPDERMRFDDRQMTVEAIAKELWQEDREERVFRTSTLRERLGVAEILATLLAHSESGDADLGVLAGKAVALDFRLEVWRVDDRVFWALLEKPGNRRGAGAYIVRVAPRDRQQMDVVLQSPHAYYDLGTDIIGLHLFFGPDAVAQAFFTNTVHRYWDGTGDNPVREDSPADVCHHADHVFQYATDAVARVLGEVAIVQLHGFADNPKRPDAIVSAGDTSGSTPVVERFTHTLGDAFGNTRRFPEEIDELGGTSNAQGRMLRNYRRAHFVHLELSKSVRKQLIQSADALTRLGVSLRWPSSRSSRQGEGER